MFCYMKWSVWVERDRLRVREGCLNGGLKLGNVGFFGRIHVGVRIRVCRLWEEWTRSCGGRVGDGFMARKC